MLARRVCEECGEVHSTKTHSGDQCGKCGGSLITRADDNEETVRERFRVYEEQTAPLIEFYSKRGLVENVDGTMPIEEEAAYIVEVLKKV